MRIRDVMEKIIAAFEARRQFGRLLQGVTVKGDKYVIERHGEPVAAVVPIEVYEQWKRARADLFAKWRTAAEQSALGPDEADELAREAVQAVRRV
jgi:prevent-host-death family protein